MSAYFSVPCRPALLLAVLAPSAFAPSLAAQAAIPALTSPDGRLEMRFSVTPAKDAAASEGQLGFSVAFKGRTLIETSPLGLELDGNPAMGARVVVTAAEPGEGVDDYPLLKGKTSHVHEPYRSLTLTVAEPEGGLAARRMQIEARAYASGVAFRYLIPRQFGLTGLRVTGEATRFRFADDDRIWALELPGYRSSYESEYVPLPLSALANQGGVASHVLVGLPLLLHQPGVAWISLMEADLEGNSSAYVTNPTGSWTGHELSVLLSPRWDEPHEAVRGELPHHSAWRVLGVAETAAGLIESNLETNLAPPSRLADAGWVKPGKAAWNWWADNLDARGQAGDKNFTTATMKEYVDFAAASGLTYFFLDAGWSDFADITKMNGTVDVPELVKYAAAKGVKVWIWLYSESVAKHMREAFPIYEKWGVAGMKIDFVNRDDQEGIDWFYQTAALAASHHLMVDFHGCHTPWGLERTWPNVMSYEGVLGLEQNKAGRRDTPANRVTLAFTRQLAGPMDYTAGAFDNRTEAEFQARNSAPMAMGTRAGQLALYVVQETPVPMLSDSPSRYQDQLGFEFLKQVPAAWDQTRGLGGEPGEYALVARRAGRDWYVGAISSWTPRAIDVPLDFLGAGRYMAEIWEDGPDAARDPKQVALRKEPVTAASVLKLKLAPGGGAAVRIVEER